MFSGADLGRADTVYGALGLDHPHAGEGRHFEDGLHPPREAAGKLLRVQGREEPTERVMTRNAVGQAEECPEPLELRVAEVFQLHPVIHPADEATDGDGQDVREQVLLRALCPWVDDGGVVVQKRDSGHRSGLLFHPEVRSQRPLWCNPETASAPGTRGGPNRRALPDRPEGGAGSTARSGAPRPQRQQSNRS